MISLFYPTCLASRQAGQIASCVCNRTRLQARRRANKQAGKQTSAHARKHARKHADKRASKRASEQARKNASKRARTHARKPARTRERKQARTHVSNEPHKQATNQATGAIMLSTDIVADWGSAALLTVILHDANARGPAFLSWSECVLGPCVCGGCVVGTQKIVASPMNLKELLWSPCGR